MRGWLPQPRPWGNRAAHRNRHATADKRGNLPNYAGVEHEPAQFEAIITPHRSLGPVGLRRLLIVLLLLSGTVSTIMWLVGAWPAIAFNVLEIGLALFLLVRHNRDRRSAERLVLTDAGLVVHRFDRAGRPQQRRLDAGWLQAVLQERPGRTPALLLIDRGRRMEVAANLGEAEKRDLAAALRAALHRLRNPVFDNAQLRDRPA